MNWRYQNYREQKRRRLVKRLRETGQSVFLEQQKLYGKIAELEKRIYLLRQKLELLDEIVNEFDSTTKPA